MNKYLKSFIEEFAHITKAFCQMAAYFICFLLLAAACASPVVLLSITIQSPILTFGSGVLAILATSPPSTHI